MKKMKHFVSMPLDESMKIMDDPQEDERNKFDAFKMGRVRMLQACGLRGEELVIAVDETLACDWCGKLHDHVCIDGEVVTPAPRGPICTPAGRKLGYFICTILWFVSAGFLGFGPMTVYGITQSEGWTMLSVFPCLIAMIVQLGWEPKGGDGFNKIIPRLLIVPSVGSAMILLVKLMAYAARTFF